jgi:hypothetical protein
MQAAKKREKIRKTCKKTAKNPKPLEQQGFRALEHSGKKSAKNVVY